MCFLLEKRESNLPAISSCQFVFLVIALLAHTKTAIGLLVSFEAETFSRTISHSDYVSDRPKRRSGNSFKIAVKFSFCFDFIDRFQP